MRIVIGGFQHETNTFAPVKASFRDFEMADGWPGLTRGTDMLSTFSGINLPIAGFIAAAKEHSFDLLPTLWCSASPSACSPGANRPPSGLPRLWRGWWSRRSRSDIGVGPSTRLQCPAAGGATPLPWCPGPDIGGRPQRGGIGDAGRILPGRSR